LPRHCRARSPIAPGKQEAKRGLLLHHPGEDARAALSPTLARFVAGIRRLSAPIPER
jgi:hypothetical protein